MENLKEYQFDYQSQKEADKNILKFKKEGVEATIEALRGREEKEVKEPLKRILRIQIANKEKELEELKSQLEELESGHA